MRHELVREAEAPGLFLKAVIWERIIKGVLLLFLGAGLLGLIHKDVGAFMTHLAGAANLDIDGTYVVWALHKVSQIKSSQMAEASAAAFGYAALCLVEATGLHLRRRWAEYLTAFATTVFIPLEVFEVLKKMTVVRVSTLLLNVVIVVYLVKSKDLFMSYHEKRESARIGQHF